MVAIYLLISLIIFIVIGIIGVEIGDSTKIDYKERNDYIMKKDFKIGDTVYVYENWSGEIVKAVVSKKSKNGVYINYQYFVDNNGKELNRFIGSSYRKFNEIWDSVAEALNIKKERNNKII